MKLHNFLLHTIAAILWWILVFELWNIYKRWDFLMETDFGVNHVITMILTFIGLSIARIRLIIKNKYEKD